MNDFKEVSQSFGRCLIDGDLITRFYDIFLASHPDIGPRFTGTDFSKQKELLRHGINLAIGFSRGTATGRMGIERIRGSHQKSQLDVSPDLYPYWKKSFIQAVSEFDKEFTPQLKNQWEEALQLAIDFIAEGYDPNSESTENKVNSSVV